MLLHNSCLRRTVAGAVCALALANGAAAFGAPAAPPPPADLSPAPETPWARIPIAPGIPVTTRPFPPRAGRDRCISVDGLAGAQLFGDRAIELSMKNGRRYRLFLARECPALSFYQGFYYRRGKAGQLCAGRDAIGARSGGECPIASIIAVRPVGQKSRPKSRRR
ncbi:hypothetical protein [Polymorphobacter fuscus]|uniref:Uncharacterized protein n=1 Tax=Sandarakinorhabdus fusca TaxID=1439888 RepID=A0A7C9KIG4_9SPHN|nr:hypothetical protein [Polymorphobacter fuscus]KAB7646389.1 hypothetical protein F9290_10135 [Polymorphobacter fuscus]MQT17620.1 hypothetical protein [Polymorphobacter fuscus]NJC09837.1 hypothetical protein [Polymorphobacter fuscus]